MNRRVFISESKRCVFQIFATKPLVRFLLANFHVYAERQDIRVFISQPVNREVVYFVLASDLQFSRSSAVSGTMRLPRQ